MIWQEHIAVNHVLTVVIKKNLAVRVARLVQVLVFIATANWQGVVKNVGMTPAVLVLILPPVNCIEGE